MQGSGWHKQDSYFAKIVELRVANGLQGTGRPGGYTGQERREWSGRERTGVMAEGQRRGLVRHLEVL